MCFVCWITTATDIHLEYIILIVLPLQKWLYEGAIILYIIRTLPVLSTVGVLWKLPCITRNLNRILKTTTVRLPQPTLFNLPPYLSRQKTYAGSRERIGNVKCILVQALRLCTGRTAHRGELRYSYTLILPTVLEGGEGSASRPGRCLPPGKTRYPLYRRMGGPQGRSGQVRKISPPPGFDPPDRPARSQSLYRLSYPAQTNESNDTKKTYNIQKQNSYSPLKNGKAK